MDKVNYVSGMEQDQISRALLIWLNEYPKKPAGVSRIEFEFLPADGTGMSMSTVQASYKTNEYISGSYDAQYQFALLYRVQPERSGDRLNADEILNDLGRWADNREDMPVLGTNIKVTSIDRNSTAAMIGRYEDRSEDYQILMQMEYEVKNNG